LAALRHRLAQCEWRSLAFSPHYADDHTAYLASTQQLYRSIDGGHSWTATGAPPDDLWLSRVAISQAGEVIVSSSAGVQQYRTAARDVLINGDAEATSGWSLSADGADYATEINYHAQHAWRLGFARGGNRSVDSFAVQTVTIPLSATLAQLSLRLYPASSETNLAPHDRPATSGDAQYVTITPSGTARSRRRCCGRCRMPRRGSTTVSISLRSRVRRSACVWASSRWQGGQTALYVDSASLITSGSNGHKVFPARHREEQLNRLPRGRDTARNGARGRSIDLPVMLTI